MAEDNRRIKIYEIDSTSPGTTVVAEDVVYVPGFVNKNYLDKAGIVEAFTPTLCSTVSEFEGYFGALPAFFEKSQSWPQFADEAIPENSEFMFNALQVDPSYVYAKELLSAGLKVVYERVNKDSEDITVDHMYKVLNGAVENIDIWQNLRDLGEYYEIKYLTSGGYPTFEFKGDAPSVAFMNSSDINISVEKTTLQLTNKGEKLITALKTNFGSITRNTVFRFIYAADREKAINCVNEDELALYKDTAVQGEKYFVTDTEKMYEIEIAEDETRQWKETPWKVWNVINLNDSTSKFVGLTEQLDLWGIILTISEDELIIATTIDFNYIASESSTIANAMLACAANRGDCVALIDHTDNPGRVLDPNKSASVFYSATNTNSKYKINVNGEFGAMFTPWCITPFTTKLTSAEARYIVPSAMPASFVYLKALAKSIQTNANWLAIAGAARGIVDITEPNISQTLRLSNTIAEDYQPRQGIAINPITNIKPYGYVIWGNRTLKNNVDNLAATSFLNIRNIVSDVKKTAYLAARRCMFEQNSDILWLNYKARITPLLDKLVAGAGLSGYDLIQGVTTEKAKLVCTIRLYPIYAVEAFEITVELSDEEISVS